MHAKMLFCLACATIAQTVLAALFSVALCRLDWTKAARLVHSRAHSDQADAACE